MVTQPGGKKPREPLRHIQCLGGNTVIASVVSSAAAKSSSLLLRCLHAEIFLETEQIKTEQGDLSGSVVARLGIPCSNI